MPELKAFVIVQIVVNDWDGLGYATAPRRRTW